MAKGKGNSKSIESDTQMLRYLTPIPHDKHRNNTTRAAIVRIGEAKKAESPESCANCYLALMRFILNRAECIWGWVDKAPAVTLYKEPKKRVPYLLPEEVNALMKELPEHQQPVIAFSLLTRLGKSNILNLWGNQLDLLKGSVSISGREMKNGNDHVIQLSDAAFKVVTAQLGKNTEHVFTYKGRKVNEINTIAIRNALKRTGIKDYRFMTTCTERTRSFRMAPPCTNCKKWVHKAVPRWSSGMYISHRKK